MHDVASLPHPGGNITGFTLYESTFAGKWLGVLKGVAPGMSRVALLINPDTAVLHGTFYSQALESAAASLRVEPAIANVLPLPTSRPRSVRSASSPEAD
jgi:putative tryptophan/tyrosine transport system substrate-binding protein